MASEHYHQGKCTVRADWTAKQRSKAQSRRYSPPRGPPRAQVLSNILVSIWSDLSVTQPARPVIQPHSTRCIRERCLKEFRSPKRSHSSLPSIAGRQFAVEDRLPVTVCGRKWLARSLHRLSAGQPPIFFWFFFFCRRRHHPMVRIGLYPSGNAPAPPFVLFLFMRSCFDEAFPIHLPSIVG